MGVPKCIRYDSHQVPGGYLLCSQFVPQVPNLFPVGAHFNPFVLPKVFILQTLEIAQNSKTMKMSNLFWEWKKLAHTFVNRFYFRSLPKSIFLR